MKYEINSVKKPAEFFMCDSAHTMPFHTPKVQAKQKPAIRGIDMTMQTEAALNSMLATLSATEWQRIHPKLEMIDMPLGTTLYDSSHAMNYVYFPCSATIALLHISKSGIAAEIAIIGREGMAGISLMVGGEPIPSRAVVQSAGYGFRLESRALKNEFGNSTLSMPLFLRYTQALITQMAQTTSCRHHHSLEQQLCRWLLLSLERQPGNELELKEDLIGDILGAEREEVMDSAQGLQRSGLIHYENSRIIALDKAGLKQRACECYVEIKSAYERLLNASLDGLAPTSRPLDLSNSP
ncbi:Crp/Fnr family transcriptional regulator [Chromobacterium vaccinii]|uniref:Crp/Fnr family transcriptional regulator n=1 Tax=Chromobacterium vaccinii TaxID=1108595 RepID=UPI0021B433B8|nr:Crp/Fnr family transcriptional regulator [Chromobacterium vaccinii]